MTTPLRRRSSDQPEVRRRGRRLLLVSLLIAVSIAASALLAVIAVQNLKDDSVAALREDNYQGCLNGQMILRTFNDRYTKPFRQFALDAARNRLALSQNPSQSPSVRRQNMRAARNYFEIADRIEPFQIPRCTR